MDETRFDGLARFVSQRLPRRRFHALLAAVSLSLLAGAPVTTVGKKKKKELQRNTFGCVDLGGKCGGKDSACCSGICQGKKPKQGKKDKSRCVGHNQGTCTPERSLCAAATANEALCNPDSNFAACLQTTGNSPFCATFAGLTDDICQPCAKDADCTAAGFPPGSACVLFTGTKCLGFCAEISGGRACLPPGI
jgi:hypothetical protein